MPEPRADRLLVEIIEMPASLRSDIIHIASERSIHIVGIRTYCTGDFIRRGGFLTDDPSAPTSPDDLLQLADAVSNLKVEIAEYVVNSVKRYLRDNDLPSSTRFNEEILKVAAQAYREAARVPEKQDVLADQPA